jgi:hypothetical protein
MRLGASSAGPFCRSFRDSAEPCELDLRDVLDVFDLFDMATSPSECP